MKFLRFIFEGGGKDKATRYFLLINSEHFAFSFSKEPNLDFAGTEKTTVERF